VEDNTNNNNNNNNNSNINNSNSNSNSNSKNNNNKNICNQINPLKYKTNLLVRKGIEKTQFQNLV